MFSAGFFSSSDAGLLLNLLLGGNNGAPQQGPNLPFLNFNNNQNAPNDYPDYNLGTSRDMNYGRNNDYDAPQQQSYPINEPGGEFNREPESTNQNDYSGSQERDYNRNPSNFNDEELRMGRPNVPTTTNFENNPRQENNNGYSDGENVNKINNGKILNSNAISKNNIAATTEKHVDFKNTASQNIALNNNKVLSKLNLNDSNANSINVLPSPVKVMNSSNIEAKNPTIVIVNIPAGVSTNSTIAKNTGDIKNVVKTKTRNLLKPITKRKFFFQVKPVMPVPKRASDMETVFYIE